jgi:hypothetical protein
MVFSLYVQPTREDGWDRDEIVRVESSLTPPALPRFLDDFDPELEREATSFVQGAVRPASFAIVLLPSAASDRSTARRRIHRSNGVR